jgi:hypothetical protein
VKTVVVRGADDCLAREIGILKTLKHPLVASIRETLSDAVVAEFVENGSLADDLSELCGLLRGFFLQCGFSTRRTLSTAI